MSDFSDRAVNTNLRSEDYTHRITDVVGMLNAL